jgi:hypothetical protein
MNANKHINNLDSLEKEIYRLQLTANESAKQLEKDLEYLRDNFFTLTKNSLKKERIKETGSSSFFDHLFKNDHVQEAVSGITDRIANNVAEAVNHLVDRIFKKHK